MSKVISSDPMRVLTVTRHEADQRLTSNQLILSLMRRIHETYTVSAHVPMLYAINVRRMDFVLWIPSVKKKGSGIASWISNALRKVGRILLFHVSDHVRCYHQICKHLRSKWKVNYPLEKYSELGCDSDLVGLTSNIRKLVQLAAFHLGLMSGVKEPVMDITYIWIE